MRIDMGLSWHGLSVKTGVHATTIKNIEEGGNTTETTLKKIADFFGCNVSDLIKIGQLKTPKTENQFPNRPISLFREWGKRRIQELPNHEYRELKIITRKVISLLTTERPDWRERNRKVITAFIDAYYSAMMPPEPIDFDPQVDAVKDDGAE